jgi:hypothetical protein
MSAESIRLRVEVEGDGIIVTMSGTAFRVIYRKQAFDVRGAPGAAISQVEFRLRLEARQRQG